MPVRPKALKRKRKKKKGNVKRFALHENAINKLLFCYVTAWSLHCYECSTRNQQECESKETLKDCYDAKNVNCLAISKAYDVTDEKGNTVHRTTYWKGCSFYIGCEWNCRFRKQYKRCKVRILIFPN